MLRNGAVRWMTAKQRQFKGLAKAPRLRRRSDFNSVLITSELFRFVPDPKPEPGFAPHQIELGTKAKPIGRIRFRPTGPYKVPKQITLRQCAGRFELGFSFDHEVERVLREPHELAYELNQLNDEELRDRIRGLDRNVRDNALCRNDGVMHSLSPKVVARIERAKKGLKWYQRRFARSKKGSTNRRKLAVRMARKHEYRRNATHDFAHQASHRAVRGDPLFIVFEALAVVAMTRRPKAKRDPKTGKWLRNGRAAKAALNSAILQSVWGKLKDFITYKAARRNILVASVPAQYSSQECSRCGHTHPGNRHESRFACQRCGLTLHADVNAARVIAKRGLALLRSGELEKPSKAKKRVAFRRKVKSGVGSHDVPVEPGVRRAGQAALTGTLQAAKQELPTATLGTPTKRLQCGRLVGEDVIIDTGHRSAAEVDEPSDPRSELSGDRRYLVHAAKDEP